VWGLGGGGCKDWFLWVLKGTFQLAFIMRDVVSIGGGHRVVGGKLIVSWSVFCTRSVWGWLFIFL
jgi:hypothetical protein